jgi:hypothetical protein
VLLKKIGSLERESVAVLRSATAVATVTTTTAVTTTVTTLAAFTALAARTAAIVFLLVDPALDPDDAVDGAGFGEAIVQGYPEGLERHLAFAVTFSAGDVGTTKTTGDAEADAFRTEVHGGLEGALHGAAEADPALKLDGDLLGDKLGVEFRLADLNDVDLDLGTFRGRCGE